MAFDRTEFFEYLKRISEVSPRDATIKGYHQNLDAMINSYKLDPENPDVLDTLKQMTHLSGNTLNQRKYLLEALLKFQKLPIGSKVEKSLKRRRHNVQRKIRPSDLLTWNEIVDICQHTQSLWLRAYIMVIFDSGRRPNAPLQLNIGDVIQARHGYILKFDRVKNEHGRRNCTMLIPEAMKAFENWLTVHPDRDNNDAPLFVNREGNRPLQKTIRNTLQHQHNARLERGSNLPKCSIFPYLFRHSRATQLLREGRLSEIEIKMRMGHKKDSNVLEQYYAILDQEDLHKAELRYLGVLEKEDNVPRPVPCPNCGAINNSDSTLCSRCHLPLSEEELQRQTQVSVDQALSTLSESSPEFQALVERSVARYLKKSQPLEDETVHE